MGFLLLLLVEKYSVARVKNYKGVGGNTNASSVFTYIDS